MRRIAVTVSVPSGISALILSRVCFNSAFTAKNFFFKAWFSCSTSYEVIVDGTAVGAVNGGSVPWPRFSSTKAISSAGFVSISSTRTRRISSAAPSLAIKSRNLRSSIGSAIIWWWSGGGGSGGSSGSDKQQRQTRQRPQQQHPIQRNLFLKLEAKRIDTQRQLSRDHGDCSRDFRSA